MTRIISILAGLFFALALLWSFGKGLVSFVTDPPKETVETAFHRHPEPLKLASDGPFGNFDKAQLKRGFQVYSEICAACHSIKHVAYRDLAALGMTESMKDRPGLPADHFPPVVYAGKGTPPDLSLITKARHGGAAYVHSLLLGYTTQPAELLKKFPDAKTPDGLYYNPYFANLNLAMPQPITADDQVTYADGTKATKDQMAKDVAAFLVWTAEPKLAKRHQTGAWWLGFLLFATVLAYMSYRNIWAEKKGH